MAHPEPASGARVYAEDIESLAERGTYIPELWASTTNPSLGGFGATAEGSWCRSGAKVYVEFHFAFGGSPSAGNGFYMVTLPIDLQIGALTNRMAFPGSVRLRDDSTTARAFRFVAHWEHASQTVLRFESQNGAVIGHNDPWVWAQNDTITGSAEYLLEET